MPSFGGVAGALLSTACDGVARRGAAVAGEAADGVCGAGAEEPAADGASVAGAGMAGAAVCGIAGVAEADGAAAAIGCGGTINRQVKINVIPPTALPSATAISGVIGQTSRGF